MHSILSRQSWHLPKWSIFVLILLLFLLLTWANYHYLTGPHRYDNRDFVSLWAGGKAILMGLDPYDPDVWGPLRIQLGNEWVPDSRAPFPLWTLLFFLPFSLFNLGWSAALWLAFSLYLLGFGLYLLVRQLGREKIGLFTFFLFALGAATYRGGMVTLFNGQLTYLLLFILVVYLVLESKRPFWAGAALACVIFKPNPFILFVPLMGARLLAQRRWQVIAGAAVSGLFWLLVSWWTIPGWLTEWLNVTGKTEVVFITPTVWGLAYNLWPAEWFLLGLLFVAGITAVLGWQLVAGPQMSEAAAVSLAIAGSLATTPYAWDYEHLLLLIPLTLVLFRLRPHWLALAAWSGLAILLPWYLYWVAIQRDTSTLSGLVPLLTGAAVYIVLFQQRIRKKRPYTEPQTNH